MILFITEHPYTYNLNGAAAFSSSHLRHLAQKFPGEAIHVVFLNKSREFWSERPDFPAESISLTPIHLPEARYGSLGPRSLRLLFTDKTAVLAKGLFALGREYQDGLAQLADLLAREKDARAIWCEHLMPVLYASMALPEETFREKVIYSHHDFAFKILRIRATALRHRLRSFLVRRLEMSVFRELRHFVSGSQSEARQIERLAPLADRVEFLPCFYPSLGPGELKPAGAGVKLYHLGTAGATANKVGIRFFFEKVFPAIEHLPFTMEFFGNIKDHILQEFPHLKDHPKLVFHGFVLDLGGKIEEGMIHVIPYSGMTGTRTRVAGLARFKPSLLGFKTIQDSYPFLANGENAMIAEDDEDFVAKLRELISDASLRRRISHGILQDMIRFEAKAVAEMKVADR